jgi:hypothetical protein
MLLIYKDLSMMELIYCTNLCTPQNRPLLWDILYPAAPVFCFFGQTLAAI